MSLPPPLLHGHGPTGGKPRGGGGAAVLPRLLISTALFVICLYVLLRSGRTGRAPADSATLDRALPAATSGTAAAAPREPGAATGSATTTVTLPRSDAAPPRRAGEVKFMGLLDNVSDYDDVAQNQAYAALADWVRHLTDDEAAKIRRDDLDYEALLKNPAELRGEMVRIMGLLVRFEPVRLVPGAGPAEVEDAWRGWVVDTSGNECYIFDTLAAPPAVEPRRDLIAVEGAFLKIVRYETRDLIPVDPDDPPPAPGAAPSQYIVMDRRDTELKDNQVLTEEQYREARKKFGARFKAGVQHRDAPFLLARRVAPVPESEVDAMKHSLETPKYVILIAGLAAIAFFVLIARNFRGGGGGGGGRALMSHHATLDEMRARLREKRSKGT